MSFPFIPLTPEDETIVVAALIFTKQKNDEFHSDWLSNSPKVNHLEIERRMVKNDKLLDTIINLVRNPKSQNKLYRGSYLDNINDYIASSLNIYAMEYEKAQDPKLPLSRIKLLKIKGLLNSARFRNHLSNLWNEFYEGYRPDKIKNGKLIFLSYRFEERLVIGNIAQILESKYGYKTFRAHDIKSIDNDEIWRDKIKENLDKCDGLVAYVTRKFRLSPWTHQECGWVMARGKPIYSLLVMKKIPGFLEEKQGTRVTLPLDYEKTARNIHEFFERYYQVSKRPIFQ